MAVIYGPSRTCVRGMRLTGAKFACSPVSRLVPTTQIILTVMAQYPCGLLAGNRYEGCIQELAVCGRDRYGAVSGGCPPRMPVFRRRRTASLSCGQCKFYNCIILQSRFVHGIRSERGRRFSRGDSPDAQATLTKMNDCESQRERVGRAGVLKQLSGRWDR